MHVTAVPLYLQAVRHPPRPPSLPLRRKATTPAGAAVVTPELNMVFHTASQHSCFVLIACMHGA